MQKISTNMISTLDALRHPNVNYIETEDLDLWMHKSEDSVYYRIHEKWMPLIVDVRSKEEFNISHLKGAIRLDPETVDFSRFSAEYPFDTIIVAYCDLGHRSSELATRLKKAGYKEVLVLRGGIFKWILEGRKLYDNNGDEVNVVHPFDHKTATLFLKKEHIPEHFPPVPATKTG